MEYFTIFTPILAGVYLLWMTTQWTTHTAIAGLVYRTAPFLTGCASIITGLKIGGIL